jgi:hypothetical protein
MCYDASFIDTVVDAGHEWIVMSGVGCPVDWPTNTIHRAKSAGGSEVGIVFRDDVLSNKISFQDLDGKGFVEHLRAAHGHDGDMYIVTAMDAETFGHHIEHWDQLFLGEAYEAVAPYADVVQARPLAASTKTLLTTLPQEDHEEIEPVTISRLLEVFPAGDVIEPLPSSWSTTREDIDAGVPYPLWKTPDNYIHKLQWEHVAICESLVETAQRAADTDISKRHADIARGLFDPALHSCQFWWASRRPHWDVNMISRGLAQQGEVVLNAFRAINLSSAAESEKREAYYQVVAANDVRAKLRDQLFWD